MNKCVKFIVCAGVICTASWIINHSENARAQFQSERSNAQLERKLRTMEQNILTIMQKLESIDAKLNQITPATSAQNQPTPQITEQNAPQRQNITPTTATVNTIPSPQQNNLQPKILGTISAQDIPPTQNDEPIVQNNATLPAQSNIQAEQNVIQIQRQTTPAPQPTPNTAPLLPQNPLPPQQNIQAEQTNIQPQSQPDPPQTPRQDSTPVRVQVSSVQQPVNPIPIEEQYEQHYVNLIKNRFEAAEKGFTQFAQQYPDHELAGNALYWLGETHYARQNYKTAAQIFLQAYQEYPKGNKAPDNLLKLGITLLNLNQKNAACDTFKLLIDEFPERGEIVKISERESDDAQC